MIRKVNVLELPRVPELETTPIDSLEQVKATEPSEMFATGIVIELKPKEEIGIVVQFVVTVGFERCLFATVNVTRSKALGA